MLTIILVLLTLIAAAYICRTRELRLLDRLDQAAVEKKKAQEELRTTLYSIGDGVITTDVHGYVTRMNRIAEKLTGWDEAEARGRLLEEIFRAVNEERRTPVQNPVVQVLKRHTIVEIPSHSVLISKDGTEYPIADSAAPIQNEEGTITGAVMVFRDQSAERAAEKELKESEEKFRKAFNTSSDAININRTEDGTYVSVNEGFTRLTGYTAEDVIGKTSSEIGIWDDPADRIRLVKGLKRHGEVQNLEAKFKTKDGKKISGLMSASLIEIGGVPLIISVSKDVTQLKTLTEQLVQSQKLEAIGSLAGGIAHDYNNILGVVIGYAQFLEKILKHEQAVEKPVKAILKAANRGAELAKQILAFARKEIVSPKVMNLNWSIDSVRKLLLPIVGENLTLAFVPGNNLWNIRMDPSQLDQILINLSTNARDAIDNVGTIRITTSNVLLVEPIEGKLPDITMPGEYVKIEFSDTGKGMDEATLRRAFEPFFTTKAKGAGTGLGLSTLYGIVKQNNGYVNVTSSPGHGTTFEIYFPKHLGEVEREEESHMEVVTRGSGTILVVEDQADLLELAKMTLERHGYNVLTALDPAAALSFEASRRGEIDLLVTDVILPVMSGKELSDRLKKLKPKLKTLFMSGYTADMLAPQGVLQDMSQFLQKPFSQDDLAERVRKLLSK